MINTNAPIRGIPGDGGTVCHTDCQGECNGSCSCGKKG